MREPVTTHVLGEDGVEVATHDYGGEGHPTFFVHGTGLVSRMWEPVMDLLGDLVRPIGIDLRGHGATRTPDGVDCFDHRMVADVSAALAHHNADGAWIVAHSMGASTAILAALAMPEAVARLWTFEPIIFEREIERPEGAFDFIEGTKRRRPQFDSREQVLERYRSRPPLDELHPDCLAAYVEHGFVDQADGTVRLACEPEFEARAFEQYLQNGWDRLPEVDQPVLVAYGSAGDDRPAIAAPAIAERLRGGVLESFDGSGHFGCFGPIQQAAESMRRWFTRA